MLAPKRNTLMGGKENGDVETNHQLMQHMISSISTQSDNVKRPAHTCSNNNISILYTGEEKKIAKIKTYKLA